MKTLKILTLCMLCCLGVQAQKVVCSEIFTEIKEKNGNAFKANISFNGEKEVHSYLRDYFKNLDAKYSEKRNEAMVENVSLLTLGTKPINVLVKYIPKNDKQGDLYMAFDKGGQFISKQNNAELGSNAEKLVYDLAFKLTQKGLNQAIEQATKAQEKLVKEKEKLVKEKENLQSTISKAKEEIEKAEVDLEENAKTTKDTEQRLESQKELLNQLKNKMTEI